MNSQLNILCLYQFLFSKPILSRQLQFVSPVVYSTFVPFLRLSHFISGKENHTSALQRSEPVSCCFLTPPSFLCSLSVVFYLFQAHFKVVVCTAQMEFHIYKCHAWDKSGWKYHSRMENGFQMDLKCILFFLLVIKKYFWLT